MDKIKLGIVGGGFVGTAAKLLECEKINIVLYDIDPNKCYPKNTKIDDLHNCDIIFICVPTPMNIDSSCYLGIVENVIKQLKEIVSSSTTIIVRSTVLPNTCDKLGVNFMPEFLTEKNWEKDFYDTHHWIVGLLEDNEDVKNKIKLLFDLAYEYDKIKYNSVTFVKNNEAELLKYCRNTYLAMKVSYCNEIEEYCRIKSIDYNIIKKLLPLDPRITPNHMKVPGPDGKRGFGGTCFPKDIHAMLYDMKKDGMKSYILKSVIERNEKVDRPLLDWMVNKGRTVVSSINDKKTVLVTGGAGFIGSHLCKYLLENNNKVICIDSLISGSIDNIQPFMSNKNFTFIKQDIIDTLFLNIDRIDQIYHLACQTSSKLYQKDPIHTTKTCFIGTLNMLEIAKKYNARLLLTSTSEIYGEPQEHPQTESYRGNVNTLGPRACYDEGKRVAETLLMDYNRMYGTDVCIARIFNTYGPNMNPNDGRVIPNFSKQILFGDDITIYGDGLQTRSFCYIDDMINGLYKLMNSKEIGPINLGNPEEYTILELANIMIDITGSQSKIIFKELPKDDPTRRKPDISQAKEKLGWEPNISLKNGLKRMV